MQKEDTALLEVCNITKRYGSKTAVEQVSFSVERGEVVGFLGTNGAGKTTTMNIITGYLSATEGSVTVDGHDVLSEPKKVKARLGYLPEIPPLYRDLTVWENLSFAYSLKRPDLDRQKHLEELCGMMQLSDVKSRLVQNLSKGYRQRVGLAAALVGDPPILILDEPTVGLDPVQIIEIRDLIKQLAQTRTVILSSHILQEVQAVCGRIVLINHGRIVADDTPDDLIAAHAQDRRIVLQARGEPEKIERLLRGVDSVKSVQVEQTGEPDACRYYLETAGVDVRPVLSFLLAAERVPLLELRYKRPTLEDVFLQLTQEPVPAAGEGPDGAPPEDGAGGAEDPPRREEKETEKGGGDHAGDL